MEYYGYSGRVLYVDLSTGNIRKEPLDMDLAHQFIGGPGVGLNLLLDVLKPNIDPLSPENMIIMATGPLTGTGAPTGARYMVMTKSPLTGAITCSNSGGTGRG